MVSFVCNFFMTSIFTFRSKASFRKGIGFGSAHIVNYLLQMLFLNIVINIGIDLEIAPVVVYLIVIPINFLMVRFVFKRII